MSWPAETSRELAGADEIEVVVSAPDRPDVRTPIWAVAVEGELYVRSWKGDAGVWYRRARRHGTGAVVVTGRRHEVRFTPADEPDLNGRIDEAYRAKYGRSPYAAAMTRPPATATTLRLDPR